MGHGSYHLHGHTHHNLHHEENPALSYYTGRKAIDVGCNGIGYTPISYLDVLEHFKGY